MTIADAVQGCTYSPRDYLLSTNDYLLKHQCTTTSFCDSTRCDVLSTTV